MYTKHLLWDSAFIQHGPDLLVSWLQLGLGLSYSATGAKKKKKNQNHRLTLNYVLEQLSKRGNPPMVNLVKFLRNKNLHEHQREKQLCRSARRWSRFLNSLRQMLLSPTAMQSFPKRDRSMKNVKPVALSFLLINSKAAGRWAEEGQCSHGWNSSEELNRKAVKRVWSKTHSAQIH